jgi:hypothetical protein
MESRKRRPVGIWFATIWAGIFAGLFPLALVLFFYFGPARGYELVGPVTLVFSVCLGGGVIVSAIGTWLGYSWARYALAVLVVIHYGFVAYQNYQLAAVGVAVRESIALPWGRVIRSIITAAIIAGYLLISKAARKFCDRHAETALTQIAN